MPQALSAFLAMLLALQAGSPRLLSHLALLLARSIAGEGWRALANDQ